MREVEHWNELAGEASVSVLKPNCALGLPNLAGNWCKMHRMVPSFSAYFCSGCFCNEESHALSSLMLLSTEMTFSCKICFEGISKKFAETKMSIKYKKSLEERFAVHILPQSNETLPLRCLNQLINPYYINYDDEKLIITYWPKNKCK